MDALALSRIQFAVTAMFHFLFVPLTLGLSILVAYMESRYVGTRDEMYLGMTKFWGKLFLINFAMCVSTYFQKVGDPQDIAPTMAVGFTINHIAAVIIPVIGGALWLWDSRLVFLAGAGLALCSLVAAQFIKTPRREEDHVVHAK